MGLLRPAENSEPREAGTGSWGRGGDVTGRDGTGRLFGNAGMRFHKWKAVE